MSDSEKLRCPVAGVCSGCDWILKSLAEQREGKLHALKAQWERAGLPPGDLALLRFRAIKPGGLRDRADLIYRRTGAEMRLGFYALEKKEIAPVPDCPAMSPALCDWLIEFRKMPPPIEAGSLRLRVSPEGKRGAWLDFSNLDVKKLLDEGSWLDWLSGQAIVEIGQRRKRLVRKEKGWGLGDPKLEYWFPTFLEGRERPLYSVIGGFTQVGFEANRALVEEVMSALGDLPEGRWVELGSGIGNLTLPLAARTRVTAIELDELAVEGLERSAAEAGLSSRIEIKRLSFQQPSEALRDALEGADGILADPPRSGLLRYTELLERARPRYFVYVSCYAESFTTDAARLYALGYRLRHLTAVDQFPQTSHCEYVARFERES